MAEVDPRFDPLFQRGYDPTRHKTKVPAPRVEERAEGTPLRSAASRRVETPEISGAPQESGQPEPLTSAQDVRDDDLEPPRRNPFRLVLLLASLAFIGGAALLLWRRLAQDPYGGFGGYGGDISQVFAQQFTDALLAPLLTGGLLGLCLWLALGAVRRR
jgi:hypothetical protein